MKAVLLFLVLVCGALATLPLQSTQQEFVKYMRKYGKTYSSTQFNVRYNIFKANLEFINKHNADRTNTHTVAVNQFADLTGAEFKQFFLGFRGDAKKHAAGPQFEVDESVTAPASLDWRTKKVVSAIKNQGQCGSCWSFSTTGSTEACHAIKYGASKLVSLSEQNLIDCSVSYGNQGCNGGLMTDAMQYIIDNGGIDTEKNYPYTTSGPNTCEYVDNGRPNPLATLKSYANVQSGNEAALQAAVSKGPVSVAIDASQNSFQFYSSGVYYEPECSSTSLDHGVLAVGWGTESGSDYWWVKNSWGTSWGDAGYIKMARNKDNNCGIATMATLPVC